MIDDDDDDNIMADGARISWRWYLVGDAGAGFERVKQFDHCLVAGHDADMQRSHTVILHV